MRIDAIALRLRLRSPMESADLGVRLCQEQARAVYTCYAMAAVPMIAICLATYEIASWLPGLLLWWAKPWLDRSVLFVLARAAFSQRTSWRDLWNSQRTVWWSQLLSTWTLRRLSPWRSFTQPVHQLEGLKGSERRNRIRQIRRGKSGSATLITSAFGFAELIFTLALFSLVAWLIPDGLEPSLPDLISGDSAVNTWQLAAALAYAIVLLGLEPLYVAAGFSMYLNRRVELEAWDIEQELRRVFAH
jgi:hypothetical protein